MRDATVPLTQRRVIPRQFLTSQNSKSADAEVWRPWSEKIAPSHHYLLQATVRGYGGRKTWKVPTCTLHRLCYVHTTVANRQPFCDRVKSRSARSASVALFRVLQRDSRGRNCVGFQDLVGRDRPAVMTSSGSDWLVCRRVSVRHSCSLFTDSCSVVSRDWQTLQDSSMFQAL